MRAGYLWCMILLLGCGSGPSEGITGTYRLVGVDAHTLPFLETSDAECDQSISEGELDLRTGGTYSLQLSGSRDCSRGGGQSSTVGRLYTGSFTQSDVNKIAYEAEIPSFGTLHFSGTANPLEAFVTVPPIPPQTGPDLILQLAIVH